MASVRVDFEWQKVGAVRVADGKVVFPKTSEVPGLYRFSCANEVYVGETDRLQRRMQHYRTPGPSQMTNIRMNAWFLERLAAGSAVELAIATAARLDVDGRVRAADLSRKEERVVVEHAAILVEFAAGRTVLNALK